VVRMKIANGREPIDDFLSIVFPLLVGTLGKQSPRAPSNALPGQAKRKARAASGG